MCVWKDENEMKKRPGLAHLKKHIFQCLFRYVRDFFCWVRLWIETFFTKSHFNLCVCVKLELKSRLKMICSTLLLFATFQYIRSSIRYSQASLLATFDTLKSINCQIEKNWKTIFLRGGGKKSFKIFYFYSLLLGLVSPSICKARRIVQQRIEQKLFKFWFYFRSVQCRQFPKDRVAELSWFSKQPISKSFCFVWAIPGGLFFVFFRSYRTAFYWKLQ